MPRLVIDVVADIAQIRAGLKDLKLDKISIPVELDTTSALKQIEKLKTAAKEAEPDIVSNAELSRAERLDKVMERIATNAERLRPAFEGAGQLSERLQRAPAEPRPPFREQTRAQVIGTVSEVGLEAVGAAATAYTTYKGIRSTTEWLRDNGPKTARGLQAAFEKLFGSFQKAGRSLGVAASSAQAGDIGGTLAGISSAQVQTRVGLRTARAAGTIAANPRAFATALSSQSVGRLIQKSLTYFVTEAVEDAVLGSITSEAVAAQREASETAAVLRKQFLDVFAPEHKITNVPKAGVVRPGSVRDVLGSKPIDQIGAMRARAAMQRGASSSFADYVMRDAGPRLGIAGENEPPGINPKVSMAEYDKRLKDLSSKNLEIKNIYGDKVKVEGLIRNPLPVYPEPVVVPSLGHGGVDDAEYRVGRVPMSQIKTDGGQNRIATGSLRRGYSRLDTMRARELAKAGEYDAKLLLPLIVEVDDGLKKSYVLLDGHHRVLRQRLEGFKSVLARIAKGFHFTEADLAEYADFKEFGIGPRGIAGGVRGVSAAIPEPKPLMSSGSYKAKIARMIYGQDGAPGGILAPAGMFGPKQVLVPPLDFAHAGISSEDIFKGIDSIGKGRMSLRLPSSGVLPMMLNHPMPQAFDVLGEGHDLFRQGGAKTRAAGMVDFERLFPHAMRAESDPEWINRIAKLGLGRPYEIAELNPRSMLSSQEWIKSWLLDQRLTKRDDKYLSKGVGGSRKTRDIASFEGFLPEAVQVDNKVITSEGNHRFVRAMLEAREKILVRVYRPILEVADKLIPMARIDAIANSPEAQRAARVLRDALKPAGYKSFGAVSGIAPGAPGGLGGKTDNASMESLLALLRKVQASYANVRKSAVEFYAVLERGGMRGAQIVRNLFTAFTDPEVRKAFSALGAELRALPRVALELGRTMASILTIAARQRFGDAFARAATVLRSSFQTAFAAVQRAALTSATFIREQYRTALTAIGNVAGRVGGEISGAFASFADTGAGQRIIATLVRVRQTIGELGIAARGIAIAGGAAVLGTLGDIGGRIRVFLEPAIASARAGAAVIQAAFIDSVAGQSIIAAFARAKAAWTVFTLSLRGALLATSIGAAMLQGVAQVADFANKVRAIADAKPFAPFTKAFEEAFAAQKAGTVLQRFVGGIQGAISKAAELAEPVSRAGAAVLRFGGSLLTVVGWLTGWTALVITTTIQGFEMITRKSRESANELLFFNKELSLGTDVLDRYKKSIEAAGLKMTDLKDIHAAFARQVAARRERGEDDVPGVPLEKGLTPEVVADREMGNVLRRIQTLQGEGQQQEAYNTALQHFGADADKVIPKVEQLAKSLGSLQNAGASPEAILAVRMLGDMWGRTTDFVSRFIDTAKDVFTKSNIVILFEQLVLKGKDLGVVLGSVGDKFLAAVGRILVGGKAMNQLLDESRTNAERGKPGAFGDNEGGAATGFVPRFSSVGRPNAGQIETRTAELMRQETQTVNTSVVEPKLTTEQMDAANKIKADTQTFFKSQQQKLSEAAVAEVQTIRRTNLQEERRSAQERLGLIGRTAEGKEYSKGPLPPAEAEAAEARANKRADAFSVSRMQRLDADIKAIPSATPKAERAEPKGEDPFKAIERLGAADAKRSLDAAKELGIDRLSVLEHMHNLELVSDSTFFARKRELREDAYNLETSQLETEKARRFKTVEGFGISQEQAEDTKKSFEGMPVKAIDAVNAYREAIANLAQHQARYNKQAIDDWNAQAAAIKALKKSIDDTQHELDTDTLPAGAKSASDVTYQQRIERASIQREFASTDLDPEKYELLSKRLGQLDEQQRRSRIRGAITDAGGELGVGRVQEDLSRDEQRIELSRKTGAISNFDAMSALGDKRKEAAVKLEDAANTMEAAYRQLGKDDPVVESRIKNLRLEIDKLRDSADVLGDSFRTALQEGIGGTLDKLMNGQIKSFKDLINSLGTDLARSFTKRATDSLTSDIAAQLKPKDGTSGILSGIGDVIKGKKSLADLFGGDGGDKRVAIDPAAAASMIDLDDADLGQSFASLSTSAADVGTTLVSELGTSAASAGASLATSLGESGASATAALALEAMSAAAWEAAAALQAVAGTSGASAGTSGVGGLGGLGSFASLFGFGGGGAGAGAGAAGASAGTAAGAAAIDWEALAVMAAFAHTGGIAGGSDLRTSKVVPIGAFRKAPRMHFGGIARDEVPIIARRGEGIFTPAQMAHLAPVNGMRMHASKPALNVYNSFTLTAPVDRRTQSQIAAHAGVGVSRAMKRLA